MSADAQIHCVLLPEEFKFCSSTRSLLTERIMVALVVIIL